MFDRVYVINLRRRPDRLAILGEQFRRLPDWPLPIPIVYRAIDGLKCTPPEECKCGPPPDYPYSTGTYGHRCTLLRLLQECLMDDVETVLVLEDDAGLPLDIGQRLKEFFAVLPADWDVVVLGGAYPKGEQINTRVMRLDRWTCLCAVGFNKRAIDLYQQRLFAGPPSHSSDVLKGDILKVCKAYGPVEMIIGHQGSLSETSKQVQAGDDWVPPVILLNAPESTRQELETWGWDTGGGCPRDSLETFAPWFYRHWETCKQRGHLPTIYPQDAIPEEWILAFGAKPLRITASNPSDAEQQLAYPMRLSSSTPVL